MADRSFSHEKRIGRRCGRGLCFGFGHDGGCPAYKAIRDKLIADGYAPDKKWDIIRNDYHGALLLGFTEERLDFFKKKDNGAEVGVAFYSQRDVRIPRKRNLTNFLLSLGFGQEIEEKRANSTNVKCDFEFLEFVNVPKRYQKKIDDLLLEKIGRETIC